jgi:hypothetical protein
MNHDEDQLVGWNRRVPRHVLFRSYRRKLLGGLRMGREGGQTPSPPEPPFLGGSRLSSEPGLCSKRNASLIG